MGSLFFEIEAKENALISARQSTLAVVREKENTAATWTDELDRLDGKWKSVEEEIPFRLASPGRLPGNPLGFADIGNFRKS